MKTKVLFSRLSALLLKCLQEILDQVWSLFEVGFGLFRIASQLKQKGLSGRLKFIRSSGIPTWAVISILLGYSFIIYFIYAQLYTFFNGQVVAGTIISEKFVPGEGSGKTFVMAGYSLIIVQGNDTTKTFDDRKWPIGGQVQVIKGEKGSSPYFYENQSKFSAIFFTDSYNILVLIFFVFGVLYIVGIYTASLVLQGLQYTKSALKGKKNGFIVVKTIFSCLNFIIFFLLILVLLKLVLNEVDSLFAGTLLILLVSFVAFFTNFLEHIFLIILKVLIEDYRNWFTQLLKNIFYLSTSLGIIGLLFASLRTPDESILEVLKKVIEHFTG